MRELIGALVYLRATTLRNVLKSRLLRLKQPKYAIGALVGAVYVYYFIVRRIAARRSFNADRMAPPLGSEQWPTLIAIAAAALMLIVALYWLWPRSRAALRFSEAEIAFLFPAPISRRMLIHYRLINVQIRLTVTSVLLGLLSGLWVIFPGNALMRIAAWWLLFATVSLHAFGSSFVITRLFDRGVTSLPRRLITFAAIVLVLGAAYLWLRARLPAAPAVTSFGDVLTYANALLNAGPLHWILLPAKWIVAPLFAADGISFLRALGPALVIYALHYAWVLRSEVSFEEASIAQAARRAVRLAAMRSGDFRSGRTKRVARRAPFALANVGRPEWAFLWKNLLSAPSYFNARTALIASALIVVANIWVRSGDHEVLQRTIAAIALVSGAYLMFFGPLLARHDLRSDLANSDMLKVYPLRGWQIVLGEVLTPVVVVTGLMWLLILTLALMTDSQRTAWATPTVRIVGFFAIALLVPLVCAIQVLLLNAAYVLFPAWMQDNRGRASGIDMLGQRIVFLAAFVMVIALALLPASIVAAIVFGVINWLLGHVVAAMIAFIAMLSLLGAEIALGIRWLGARFEHFDLSAELRP